MRKEYQMFKDVKEIHEAMPTIEERMVGLERDVGELKQQVASLATLTVTILNNQTKEIDAVPE